MENKDFHQILQAHQPLKSLLHRILKQSTIRAVHITAIQKIHRH